MAASGELPVTLDVFGTASVRLVTSGEKVLSDAGQGYTAFPSELEGLDVTLVVKQGQRRPREIKVTSGLVPLLP